LSILYIALLSVIYQFVMYHIKFFRVKGFNLLVSLHDLVYKIENNLINSIWDNLLKLSFLNRFLDNNNNGKFNSVLLRGVDLII